MNDLVSPTKSLATDDILVGSNTPPVVICRELDVFASIMKCEFPNFKNDFCEEAY